MNASSLRKVLLGSTLAALAATPAFAILPAGKGELFVTSKADVLWDSNIYLDNEEISDEVFTFTPGLAYVRNAGLVKLNVEAAVEIQKFSENTRHNSEDGQFNFQLTSTEEAGKTDGQLAFKALRTSYANPYLNARTVTDVYGAKGTIGHWITEKLGFRFNTDISDERSANGAYATVRRQLAGASFRYLATPKLETYASYTYRHSGTYDDPIGRPLVRANDNRFSLGAQGDLLAKLTATVEGGFVARDLKRNDETETFKSPFAMVALDYVATEKTSFRLEANKDFDTTAASQSVNRLDVTLSATQTFTPKFSVTATVSYMHGNYAGGTAARSDDLYLGQLSADYKFTDMISAGVFGTVSTSDSTFALAEYDRNTVGFTLRARF